MSEIRTIRHTSYNRRQAKRETGGYIKRKILIQTGICAVIFAVVFGADSVLGQGDFAKNAARFILNENTDFVAVWEDTKEFFKDKVELTALLTKESEIDPVLSLKAPAKGEIYRHFGLEKNEKTGEENFCYGVKIAQNEGEMVWSSAEGEVVECGRSDLWGQYLLIRHSEKIYTFYAYLGELLVGQQEKVRENQAIAKAGMNNKENRAMIYFEIRENDNCLDPEAFIDFSDEKGKND